MSQTPRTSKGYPKRLAELRAKLARTRARTEAARLLLASRVAAPPAWGEANRQRQARGRHTLEVRITELTALEAAQLEALVQMERAYIAAQAREARENPDTGPPPVAA